MNQWFSGFAVCVLGLLACNVEHYEDCGGDGFESAGVAGGDDDRGPTGTHEPGPGAAAGNDDGTDAAGGSGTTGTGGGGGAGETGATGGTGGTGSPGSPPAACDEERDCSPGTNCDYETRLCVAADEETCGELATERACSHRSDCAPIYAGTNCSCGQDCECRGGEPGCVCEAFQFFACAPAQK